MEENSVLSYIKTIYKKASLTRPELYHSGGDGINSTGWSGDEIKVISSAHAEIPLDQQGNKTSDPVLQGFALSPNEKIIGMRRGPENLTTAAASTSSMSEQSQVSLTAQRAGIVI